MGKMSELALLLDEFREANRRANELAEEISAMLSGEEPHPHEKAKEVKPLTLEEVGAIYGVTRERIRQIEAKALRKLGHPSKAKKLKDFW